MLAVSCLSDEPNVSEDVAIRLIDRLAGLLRETDDMLVNTAASEAIAEVGASLWGPLLTRRLVMTWLSASPDNTVLGSLALMSTGQYGPTDHIVAVRVWLSKEVRKLASADRIERICAALAIAEAAYKRQTRQGGATLAMVPRLGSALMKMLNFPGRESHAAAWAIAWLAKHESPIWILSAKQKSTLISHIKNPRTSTYTARFLLWTLTGDHSQDRKFAQAVSTHLRKAPPKYQESLVESYIELFPTYADPIIPLVGHASAPVRDAAARLLGQLGDARAVEPLIAVLSGPDGQVRDAVAEALGQLGDTRAVEPLIAAKQEHELAAPSTVVAVLATLGNGSALREFQVIMKGHSSEARSTALWTLASRERDEHDRILLSRDADGLAPGIDPVREIGPEDIKRYAHAANLGPQEVCRRYEQLQRKYLLHPSW